MVMCSALQGSRWVALARGSISSMSWMPFSTVRRVPPVSWMLKTLSVSPTRRLLCDSQVPSWLDSQPRPTTTTPQKLACVA